MVRLFYQLEDHGFETHKLLLFEIALTQAQVNVATVMKPGLVESYRRELVLQDKKKTRKFDILGVSSWW